MTVNHVSYYRKQAAKSRQLAQDSPIHEYRLGYLQLATAWDELADEVEHGTFISVSMSHRNGSSDRHH
jgi:hypothetical protein